MSGDLVIAVAAGAAVRPVVLRYPDARRRGSASPAGLRLPVSYPDRVMLVRATEASRVVSA